MKPKSGRPDRIRRVESLVRQTVATGLAEVLDGEALVTVTVVEVTPDLRNARVWLGINGEDTEGVMAGIMQTRQQLQRRLGEAMSTKFVPRLDFQIDKSGPYSQQINQLLKEI